MLLQLVRFTVTGGIADDADVNFDGKVNIQDLALVGGNYDLDSAVAYEDWLSASLWTGVYPPSAPASLKAPEAGVQEIYTAEEFAWVLSQADMFPTGITTVRLMSDIDLLNFPWIPSEALDADVTHIFDGNGHTIYNLYVVEAGFAGLFYEVNTVAPRIQDLVIDGAYVEATGFNSYAGVVVTSHEYRGGGFHDVTVRNATVKATKYAGVIAAYIGGGIGADFIDCTVEDLVLDVQEMPEGAGVDKPHVGGIVGLMNAGTFTGNTVTDLTITIHPATGYGTVQTTHVGALIGTAQLGVLPVNPGFASQNSISGVTYNGSGFNTLIGLDNH